MLVLCAAGSRSQQVTGYLLQQGWEDVGNVAGGITAWERMGLPVDRGAGRRRRGHAPRLTPDPRSGIETAALAGGRRRAWRRGISACGGSAPRAPATFAGWLYR